MSCPDNGTNVAHVYKMVYLTKSVSKIMPHSFMRLTPGAFYLLRYYKLMFATIQ